MQDNIQVWDVRDRIDYVLNKQKPQHLFLLGEAANNPQVDQWLGKKRLKSRCRGALNIDSLVEEQVEAGHILALVKELSGREKLLFEKFVEKGSRLRLIKC